MNAFSIFKQLEHIWTFSLLQPLHKLILVYSLRWRHNDDDSVSNHQPHDCLLNYLLGRISKITSKLRVTGLFAGNSPWTGEFPAQMASNADMFSFDDVIMCQLRSAVMFCRDNDFKNAICAKSAMFFKPHIVLKTAYIPLHWPHHWVTTWSIWLPSYTDVTKDRSDLRSNLLEPPFRLQPRACHQF